MPVLLPSPYSTLIGRLDADPTTPWITDVDLASGERAELSVTSMVNAVAKAAHLVRGLEPYGDGPVRVAVLLPARWQSLALVLGCWGAGALVVLDRSCDLNEVDAVVLGPQAAADPPDVLPDSVWASRLHSLGLPFEQPPAFPVEDLALLLRGQPDEPPPDTSRPDEPAAQLAEGLLTHADLAGAATDLAVGLDADARVLSALPMTTPAGLAVATALTAGDRRSLVLARPVDDQAALARLCATEGVTATAGVTVPGVPRLR